MITIVVIASHLCHAMYEIKSACEIARTVPFLSCVFVLVNCMLLCGSMHVIVAGLLCLHWFIVGWFIVICCFTYHLIYSSCCVSSARNLPVLSCVFVLFASWLADCNVLPPLG